MRVPELHKRAAPRRLKFSIVVVSTSRFKAMQEGRERVPDITGDTIMALLSEAGHEVLNKRVVPDSVEAIRAALAEEVARGADAIIFAGGTGLSPTDVTIEAIRPLLDKEIPGFGEFFRRLSYEQVGTAAMLSRALAGVKKGVAIFCLPGSPDAAELAVRELILPEVGHIIKHARESEGS